VSSSLRDGHVWRDGATFGSKEEALNADAQEGGEGDEVAHPGVFSGYIKSCVSNYLYVSHFYFTHFTRNSRKILSAQPRITTRIMRATFILQPILV
jgi:hypothetical protein